MSFTVLCIFILFNLVYCDVITTIAGTASAGYSGDNVAATTSSLYNPVGVSVDSSSNVYVCDRINSRVRKITSSTGIITTIAGTGVNGHTGDGGAASSASLCDPLGLRVDSSGIRAHLYHLFITILNGS